MGSRYYKFFSILRMALKNKLLYCSAPGNKKIHKILSLFRSKGLIGGFCLDFSRKRNNEGYWHGYPRYKVFLKYNYYGVPIIKKLDCFKLTKTNFLLKREKYPLLRYSAFWLTSEKLTGINLLTSENIRKNNRIICRIQI